MSKVKLPPWKISIWRKHIQIAAFEIPAHKLGTCDVGKFLHALVVRSRTETLEDMIPYYVNARRGSPDQLPFARVIPYLNDELTENGYWCGEWACYAKATQTMNEEWGAAVRKIRAENSRSA